ncbi:MAG: ThuA domain-containing protein [Planctomycetota bacterium]
MDAEDFTVVYDGQEGAGKGKHVVLISGDEEYRSEEALPQLGKILAVRHGFRCTVLFPIHPVAGTIHPPERCNIPGLAALDQANLMVIATRFRDLPDAQMKHIVAYVDSGKPILGLRTATHAFRIENGGKYARYDYRSKDWDGGFGRQVLGETWIRHHGKHGKQATRGILVKEAAGHPILRGITDGGIFGPSDVYGVRLPLPPDCSALVLGQVLAGMAPDAAPVSGKVNEPMMPIAWTRLRAAGQGRKARVFTTTMGAATDLRSEGTRRLLVNACYWALGLEDRIPERSNVDLVGDYEPTPFGFGKYKKGVRPKSLGLER